MPVAVTSDRHYLYLNHFLTETALPVLFLKSEAVKVELSARQENKRYVIFAGYLIKLKSDRNIAV